MSGIRNIKKLAKQYKKAAIYFHGVDLDGITSGIAMREYLKSYGIETIEAHKINYGDDEFNIHMPQNDSILPVMVDFSHGKSFIKIHTDHHQKQIEFDDAIKFFKHSKSNASAISSTIGNGIFTNKDEKIIDMIDSATYIDYNVKPGEVSKCDFHYDKRSDNQMKLGLACNKLLLTYKNKPIWMERLVLDCQPSLISIYNKLMDWNKFNMIDYPKKFKTPKVIEENVQKYFEKQKEREIFSNDLNDINLLNDGQYIDYNGIVVQHDITDAYDVGCYDRYTIFKYKPNMIFYVMLWTHLGMIQISKNPWKDENIDINLGELILNKLIEEKWKDKLMSIDISLLAIKKEFEKNIDINDLKAIGFNYNDLLDLIDKSDIHHNNKLISDEEENKIKICMNLKPCKYNPNDNCSKERAEQSMKMIYYLNEFKIPLYKIIMAQSGGHKTITNLTGFGFMNQQEHIDKCLQENINPYKKEYSKDAIFKSFEYLNKISIDMVKVLQNIEE